MRACVAAVSDLALIIWRRPTGPCAHDGISPHLISDIPGEVPWILADDRDGLSRSNVVARIPVVFT